MRFHPEEEKNETQFAQALARLGDLYGNDAFGSILYTSMKAEARRIARGWTYEPPTFYEMNHAAWQMSRRDGRAQKARAVTSVAAVTGMV